MPKILMVAPFSGRKVGGGLATLNQQLVEALAADNANDVRMLTPRLPDHSAADPGTTAGPGSSTSMIRKVRSGRSWPPTKRTGGDLRPAQPGGGEGNDQGCDRCGLGS